MSRLSTTVHDVFLSHAVADSALAVAVSREFASAGISVFSTGHIEPGEEVQEAILREIGTSLCFAVLLTPTAVHNPNLPLEVGVAWGLAIPTYVLLSGLRKNEIPVYLSKYRACELWGDVPKLLEEVRTQTRPFTDDQRQALVDGYMRLGLSVDRLLSDPSATSVLAKQFRSNTGTLIKPDRLLQELLRMRKGKKLPKLSARSAG